MKKTILLLFASLFFNHITFSQQLSSKERAALIAKEYFSKSKYKKKEKYGITKEMNKVVISTPAIKKNVKEYSGVYKANGADYTIVLNTADKKNINGTLKEAGANNNYNIFTLKNITIEDALFKAVKINPDGTKSPLEGVFIDKNDNGTLDFGLGLKLSKSITINDALQTDKLFMKKVE